MASRLSKRQIPMNDQNNEDFKDLEKTLRKALSSEKQTGLSPSQLNSLHLMITREQFKKTKARPAWKNWLIPSSILATAMVAFMVFDRFPNSESNSVSTETSAPWVANESPTNTSKATKASKSQGPEQKKKVAQKKDAAPETPPPAAAPMDAEPEAEQMDGARNRAGPKLAKPVTTKPEPAKHVAAKPKTTSPAKEKVWESKGSASQTPPPANSPSPGIGGGGASFGSLADNKSESNAGTGTGKSLGMSLKKSESKIGNTSTVSILQTSKLSADTSKRLQANVGKLSVCNSKASTWNISFEVIKNGKVSSPKAAPENDDSGVAQSDCIVDAIRKWNLGSTSVGLINLKIKFSGK